MPIFIAYSGRKEVTYKDSTSVYYPKNIPALSLYRTQSVLRFRGFLDVLKGHNNARREYQTKGEK
jgi:hypothetical protein